MLSMLVDWNLDRLLSQSRAQGATKAFPPPPQPSISRGIVESGTIHYQGWGTTQWSRWRSLIVLVSRHSHGGETHDEEAIDKVACHIKHSDHHGRWAAAAASHESLVSEDQGMADTSDGFNSEKALDTASDPVLPATETGFVDEVLLPNNAFQRWSLRLEQKIGLEARGIERVPEDVRARKTVLGDYVQMGLIWFSANLTANNTMLGLLGPMVFYLGLADGLRPSAPWRALRARPTSRLSAPSAEIVPW